MSAPSSSTESFLPDGSKGALANYGSTSLDKASGKTSSVSSTSLLLICGLICGVELCERLAFYTFNGTQAFFLERVGYSLAAAGGINAAMVTLCMAWTLLAGWIADAYLGLYWTILASGLLYCSGSFVCAFAAWPAWQSASVYLIGMMVLVPLGTAGIKSNISNFGANQFDVSTPEGKEAQERFFSWFYVSINVGAALAYGFLTTFASSGGLGIDKVYGYFSVYMVAALAMAVAVVLFVSGRNQYSHKAVSGNSAFASAFRYLASAARHGSLKAIFALIGALLVLVGLILSVLSSLLYFHVTLAPILTWSAAIATAFGIALTVCCNVRPTWVQSANLPDEGLPAGDVEDYYRLLPVLLTGNLAFGALYNSMQFWYQHQACQMDLRIFPGSASQVSGSFFNVADCVAVIVCTPVILSFIHPTFERVTGTKIGLTTKYSVGIGFGVASAVVAAVLEYIRRSVGRLDIASNCAPHGVNMSAVSASWMLIPFFLMGIAEIYVNPTLMFFAYQQSPPSMRTLSAVTFLFMMGVTTALFSILVFLLAEYVPDDLNKGHLEYGYYANIVIAGFFLSVFFVVSRRFQEKSYA